MTGFTTPGQPAGKACSHAGLWEAATIAGFGLMMCTGCGRSYSLMIHDGQLYWQEVERLDGVELAETLRPVRKDEDGPERLLEERVEAGRAGPPVPVVPGRVEPDAGTLQEDAA